MRTRARAPSAGALLAALAGAAWPGCGGGSDGIDRQPVSGAVSLDGKPLARGEVTFSPIDDGPSAGGTLAGGSYSVARSDGPAPGAYRVEIVSMQPTGRKLPDPDGPPGSTVEELKNVVPERYNLKSELKVEVKVGPNRFDFDLTSVPKKRP